MSRRLNYSSSFGRAFPVVKYPKSTSEEKRNASLDVKWSPLPVKPSEGTSVWSTDPHRTKEMNGTSVTFNLTTFNTQRVYRLQN